MTNTKALTELVNLWTTQAAEAEKIVQTTVDTYLHAVARESKLTYERCAVSLKSAIRGIATWTPEKPTAEGLYLLLPASYDVPVIAVVEKGRWEKTQNPDLLYVRTCLEPAARPVIGILGRWLGPIALPKEKYD